MVVGAAEGMGLAVGERLARSHPGRLVLADVQGDKVAGVAERLRRSGTDCVAVPMDLTERMVDAGAKGGQILSESAPRFRCGASTSPATSPTWSCSCFRSKAR